MRQIKSSLYGKELNWRKQLNHLSHWVFTTIWGSSTFSVAATRNYCVWKKETHQLLCLTKHILTGLQRFEATRFRKVEQWYAVFIRCLVLFHGGIKVGWEVIIAGFVYKVTARWEKEKPVDSIGSSCAGVIVCCLKWHKWLLFSGHTLQGPAFLLRTMTHDSLGSSQVDRLTHTASVAHLRPGPAAWTCSSQAEKVTVTYVEALLYVHQHERNAH